MKKKTLGYISVTFHDGSGYEKYDGKFTFDFDEDMYDNNGGTNEAVIYHLGKLLFFLLCF